MAGGGSLSLRPLPLRFHFVVTRSYFIVLFIVSPGSFEDAALPSRQTYMALSLVPQSINHIVLKKGADSDPTCRDFGACLRLFKTRPGIHSKQNKHSRRTHGSTCIPHGADEHNGVRVVFRAAAD